MRKARTYDLATTNIAGLGTDLEKSIREAAAGHEPAWVGKGKKVETSIWRIEKFQVVPWPKKQYGSFYSGDSYIILHTYKKGTSEALLHDIHFWIGNESSQDEYGTAAYKTVELDDFLGGAATQYRECQGRESRRFQSLFKKVIILEGGVDSGFNHVKPLEYRSRLLHAKGKLHIMVREVPILASSFNAGDSFIYDGGLKVYVWHGEDAGAMEKSKAAAIAQTLNDQRGGQVNCRVFEQGRDDAEFWKSTGLAPSKIASAAEGGADDEVDLSVKRLCRFNDKSGLTEVSSGDNIRRDQLDSGDVFILDNGYEVVVWVGLKSSKLERKGALDVANVYLKQFQRPLDMPIQKVMEGGENETFEQSFEVGVKSGKDGKSHVGRVQGAAASTQADYKGSGGPGVIADMDALYAQTGVDPDAWKGRDKKESAYAAELKAAGGVWKAGKAPKDLKSGGAGATLKPAADFNADADAKALRKAMKGFGTREGVLTTILGARPNVQRQAIRNAYEDEVKRDLKEDLCKETSGNFHRLLKALVHNPAERVAELLHKGLEAFGTDDTLVCELLCTLESPQAKGACAVYNHMFDKRNDLSLEVEKETSGNYRKVLLAIIKGSRGTSQASSSASGSRAAADATLLYKAGEKRIFGTDEDKFIEIFTHRSFDEIRNIAEEYPKVSKKGRTLREAIEHEMSGFFEGNFRRALLNIHDYATNPTRFWAVRIFKSMKGLGTHDRSLINAIVERSELDMVEIKEMFPEISGGKSLKDWITGDTSGHYRKLLLKLIGE